MNARLFPLALLGLVLAAAPVLAHGDMDGMHESMPMDMADSDSDVGPRSIYDDAMMKMHEDMSITPTGDADRDFVLSMIPHHQGAIDMAKILLEKGKDPFTRKLAQDIIAGQSKEVAAMQDWLRTHPEK